MKAHLWSDQYFNAFEQFLGEKCTESNGYIPVRLFAACASSWELIITSLWRSMNNFLLNTPPRSGQFEHFTYFQILLGDYRCHAQHPNLVHQCVPLAVIFHSVEECVVCAHVCATCCFSLVPIQMLWYLHSQTTTDTASISHSAAHQRRLTACRARLCLRAAFTSGPLLGFASAEA